MKTIRELEIEISKHRKLINGAIASKTLSHINYHHYEIVRLIGLIDEIEAKSNDTLIKPLWAAFINAYKEEWLKVEDHVILTGELPNNIK